MSDGATSAAATLDVAALDAAPADEFGASVAPLFEGVRRFLERLAAARPFGTWSTLFERAREIAHAMPEEEQIELVDAHPRLGAPPGSVSAMSFREQGYDRERAEIFAATRPSTTLPARVADGAIDGLIDPFDDDPPLAPDADANLTPEATAQEQERQRIQAKLDYLNRAYEARFGFRYCVFVAGRPRSELIPEMAAALGRERDSELRRALDAVIDIAIDRRSKAAPG